MLGRTNFAALRRDSVSRHITAPPARRPSHIRDHRRSRSKLCKASAHPHQPLLLSTALGSLLSSGLLTEDPHCLKACCVQVAQQALLAFIRLLSILRISSLSATTRLTHHALRRPDGFQGALCNNRFPSHLK
ncbi:hypothetical protein K505DRAFT_51353 [Melanomma pulvis-pyrius CBS 109.77]|uniref:Uncharacterized protein n=1 Tax=Melanomma pulvis-pyrius CBS 109.77 TaxID=1314802 RepID=A0A6A6X9Q3_9PLEO|nr:hypothetical protein K505DRAFT_51353 [Melanomma pulvis-pyrius CBS 109.77]